MPPAHAACLAMLAPVMTMREGAGIYRPGGPLLEAGDRLEQPGLVRALELVADEGARTFYTGTIADALLALMRSAAASSHAGDLDAYEAAWLEPVEAPYRGHPSPHAGGLSQLVDDARAAAPPAGFPRRAPSPRGVLAAPAYIGRRRAIRRISHVVDGEATPVS